MARDESIIPRNLLPRAERLRDFSEQIWNLEGFGQVVTRPHVDALNDVFVRIAPKGESILRKIVASRKVDLKKAGPVLVEALNTLIKNKGGKLKS